MRNAASSSPRSHGYPNRDHRGYRRRPAVEDYQDDAVTARAWYEEDEDDDYASNDADESTPGMPMAARRSIPRLPAAMDSPGRSSTGRHRALDTGTSGRASAARRVPRQDAGWYADDDTDEAPFAPRERSHSQARSLKSLGLSTARLPAVNYDDTPLAPPARPVPRPAPPPAVYRPGQLRARVRVHTQALVEKTKETAKSPVTGVRFVLALAAIAAALLTSHAAMGEPPQPLMSGWRPSSTGANALATVAQQVVPETQGKRPDLYDSYQQFQDWWDAACSAAASSEVLTAWGVPHATIGRLIDVMQPDIAMYGGLLNYHGFQRGAATFGYRADIYMQMSDAQVRYAANTLGLPVIVNVRISYGYYHYFDTGHFLVVTAGDSQGMRIVDSSEYYIHYLPLDVFNSMYTGAGVIIVPKDYHYTIAA